MELVLGMTETQTSFFREVHLLHLPLVVLFNRLGQIGPIMETFEAQSPNVRVDKRKLYVSRRVVIISKSNSFSRPGALW